MVIVTRLVYSTSDDVIVPRQSVQSGGRSRPTCWLSGAPSMAGTSRMTELGGRVAPEVDPTAVLGRNPALNALRRVTINMPSPEGGVTSGLDAPRGQYISNVVYAATSSIVVGDTIQSRDCRGRLP
jgi:hypothetical protein